MNTNNPPGDRRRYSDVERAEALATLAANNNNVLRTAELLGIPRTTLLHWANDVSPPAPVAELREGKKAELADRLEVIAGQMLGVVENGLDRISPSQAAVIAGIAIEKFLLLRGQPTQITEARDDSRAELLRERYAKLHAPAVAEPSRN